MTEWNPDDNEFCGKNFSRSGFGLRGGGGGGRGGRGGVVRGRITDSGRGMDGYHQRSAQRMDNSEENNYFKNRYDNYERTINGRTFGGGGGGNSRFGGGGGGGGGGGDGGNGTGTGTGSRSGRFGGGNVGNREFDYDAWTNCRPYANPLFELIPNDFKESTILNLIQKGPEFYKDADLKQKYLLYEYQMQAMQQYLNSCKLKSRKFDTMKAVSSSGTMLSQQRMKSASILEAVGDVDADAGADADADAATESIKLISEEDQINDTGVSMIDLIKIYQNMKRTVEEVEAAGATAPTAPTAAAARSPISPSSSLAVPLLTSADITDMRETSATSIFKSSKPNISDVITVTDLFPDMNLHDVLPRDDESLPIPSVLPADVNPSKTPAKRIRRHSSQSTDDTGLFTPTMRSTLRHRQIITEEEHALRFRLPKRKFLKVGDTTSIIRSSKIALDALYYVPLNTELIDSELLRYINRSASAITLPTTRTNEEELIGEMLSRARISLSSIAIRDDATNTSVVDYRQLHLESSEDRAQSKRNKSSQQIRIADEPSSSIAADLFTWPALVQSSSHSASASLQPPPTLDSAVIGSSDIVRSAPKADTILATGGGESTLEAHQTSKSTEIVTPLPQIPLPQTTTTSSLEEDNFQSVLMQRMGKTSRVSTPLSSLVNPLQTDQIRYSPLIELNSIEELEDQGVKNNVMTKPTYPSTAAAVDSIAMDKDKDKDKDTTPHVPILETPHTTDDYRRDWYEILRSRPNIIYPNVATAVPRSRAHKKKKRQADNRRDGESQQEDVAAASAAVAAASSSGVPAEVGPLHTIETQPRSHPFISSLALLTGDAGAGEIVSDTCPPSQAANISERQESYNQFILDNIENVSLMLDNAQSVRIILESYRRTLRDHANSNLPVTPYRRYNPDILINTASPISLKIKSDIIRNLIQQNFFNYLHIDSITNRQTAAIAFAFILELKNVGIISVAQDGCTIALV